MNYIFIVIFALLVFPGCNRSKHKQLIDFSVLQRDLTEEESQNWPAKKFGSRQDNDTLVVILEFPGEGCRTFKGDIKIIKDNLVVIYEPQQEPCKELVLYSLRFRISNPQKINYNLAYEKR